LVARVTLESYRGAQEEEEEEEKSLKEEKEVDFSCST
jgi:hypothetical protein